MKKDIHPKLNKIKVALNGLTFYTYSTYSKGKELVYSHAPITLASLQKKSARTDVAGVQKFHNKYGDIFGSSANAEEKAEDKKEEEN